MENKLKELRLGRNLTQEELARALDVTRQTIIAIENNKYDRRAALLGLGAPTESPLWRESGCSIRWAGVG